MSYTFKRDFRFEGESTAAVGVIADAYRCCRELQTTPLDVAFARIEESIIDNDREEFTAYLNGEIVAFACIVIDEDMHVGKCIGVQWNYSMASEPITGFTRRLFHRLKVLSEHLEIPYAYTKRTGEGQYQLKYKEYHRGKEG